MKQLNVTRWAPERVAGPHPRATVEEGTRPEDCMAPEYWAHVAMKMRRYMQFEILDECGEWIARAYVADCGRNWARIVIDNVVSLAGETPNVGGDPRAAYKVEYRAQDKWRIRRLSDNAIIERHMESKLIAERRLDGHLTALAA